MQYWINHKGVQSGPVDLDGLKDMGLTSSAYVWHEGLTDWVKITQLPELQGYYEMEPVVVGTPVEPVVPAPAAEQPIETVAQTARQPEAYEPEQPATGYGMPAQPQYEAPVQAAVTEPCPPTNLVWAILTTLLCCLPAGIVAIIYATRVTSKYNAGDLEGAKRASETGAWWCIASIILGIICQPFMSLITMMAGSV